MPCIAAYAAARSASRLATATSSARSLAPTARTIRTEIRPGPRIPQRSVPTAAAIGGRAVASVDEALAAAQAVVIAASTNVHAELVSRAIDAKLPIFVEKPLAFDLAETARVVEKAEAAAATVQVGFQRRFDP